MICTFCNRETDKAVKCNIKGIICFKCCFNISSGSPEHLKRIKNENKLIKAEVLRICGECGLK